MTPCCTGVAALLLHSHSLLLPAVGVALTLHSCYTSLCEIGHAVTDRCRNERRSGQNLATTTHASHTHARFLSLAPRAAAVGNGATIGDVALDCCLCVERVRAQTNKHTIESTLTRSRRRGEARRQNRLTINSSLETRISVHS